MNNTGKKIVLIGLIFIGLLLLGSGVAYYFQKKQPPSKKLVQISQTEGKSKFNIYGEIVSFNTIIESISVAPESASATVEVIPGQNLILRISNPQVFNSENKSVALSDIKKGQKADFFGSIVEKQLVVEVIYLK